MIDANNEHKISMSALNNTLETLQYYKPKDRSELARRYAVTITEMEKVVAYFKTFVFDIEEEETE